MRFQNRPDVFQVLQTLLMMSIGDKIICLIKTILRKLTGGPQGW